jgi:hypothetical protein
MGLGEVAMRGLASRSLAGNAWAILVFLVVGTYTIVFGAGLGLTGFLIVSGLMVAAFLAAARSIARRDFSYFDPGILFGLVVLLYVTVPISAFAIFGLTLPAVADGRLLTIPLTEDDIFYVGRASMAAFGGFGIAYLLLRDFHRPESRPGDTSAAVLLPIFLVSMAITLAVAVAIRARGGGYVEEYLFYRDIPVALLQVLNINAVIFPATIWALVYIFLTRRRRGAAFLIVTLGVTILVLSSSARTGPFLAAIGSLFIYDRVYAPLRARVVLPLAVIGLLSFLALGFLRDTSTFSGDATQTIATRSELMSIFTNSLDILYRKRGGSINAPPEIYYADLFRLVPQQVFPFQKITPDVWYVTTYYPRVYAAGGAYAFGLVSEAMLGGGLPEAMLRGLLLGMLIAAASNRLSSGPPNVWKVVAATWLFVTVYQCFRDTTFVIVARAVYQFMPALLVLVLADRLVTIAVANWKNESRIKRLLASQAPLSEARK